MGSARSFAPERLLVAILSSRRSEGQAAALEIALLDGKLDPQGPLHLAAEIDRLASEIAG